MFLPDIRASLKSWRHCCSNLNTGIWLNPYNELLQGCAPLVVWPIAWSHARHPSYLPYEHVPASEEDYQLGAVNWRQFKLVRVSHLTDQTEK